MLIALSKYMLNKRTEIENAIGSSIYKNAINDVQLTMSWMMAFT